MMIRTMCQVAAGMVAGAVLVGVPAWAVASQDGSDSGANTSMSQKMCGVQSQRHMMSSMSKSMQDPEMRKEMRSMMADSMAQMPGMAGKGMAGKGMSGMGMSGMGQMNREQGSSSSPSKK